MRREPVPDRACLRIISTQDVSQPRAQIRRRTVEPSGGILHAHVKRPVEFHTCRDSSDIVRRHREPASDHTEWSQDARRDVRVVRHAGDIRDDETEEVEIDVAVGGFLVRREQGLQGCGVGEKVSWCACRGVIDQTVTARQAQLGKRVVDWWEAEVRGSVGVSDQVALCQITGNARLLRREGAEGGVLPWDGSLLRAIERGDVGRDRVIETLVTGLLLLQDRKDGKGFGHACDAVSGCVADFSSAAAEAAADFGGVVHAEEGVGLGCDLHREGGFVVLILAAQRLDCIVNPIACGLEGWAVTIKVRKREGWSR